MSGKPSVSAKPFHLAKLLSWSFFVLILGSNLVLSIFLANFARQTLLEKQRQYAALLAENINHQVFQRFTMPTLIGFGRIQLSNEAQYDHLDKVIQSTVHGFHVLELRVYDFDQMVAYSTNQELVSKTDLGGPAVAAALKDGRGEYEIISKHPAWLSFFELEQEPESVVLKTIYTLRADRRLDRTGGPSGPVMGVLEFSQDITEDYQTVINFQRLIILSTVVSSLMLFFVLVFIIKRADQMAAERALEKEKLERELHQSEKMASMGRMVSGVAHEIRNPLGIIRSSAELLFQKAKAEASPNTRILQAIFEESKRLSRTVNDFLDYARPKPPRMDDVDLAAVVNQVLVFLEPKCRELGVNVSRRLPERIMVKGDKDLLYRACYNLVANSLEAMGGAGEIVVSAERANGETVVTFADSGPGFAAELLQDVLDPFFTTKDTGTGLGLAIVDTVLKGHGAELFLGNRPEGGALVTIRFPAAETA